MRLTVLAFALLPMAAQAQSTTLPAPSEPLAQGQSCPVGMAWDAGANVCAEMAETALPLNGSIGCGHGAAREATS